MRAYNPCSHEEPEVQMLTVAFGAPSASEAQQLCDSTLLNVCRQGRWCDMANTNSTYHSSAMHNQPWGH